MSVFPLGKEESVSKYVSEVVKQIDQSGYNYKLNSMGTVIETETIDQALELISKSFKILEPHSNRIYCTAKFDSRKGYSNQLEHKVKAIAGKLGKVKT